MPKRAKVRRVRAWVCCHKSDTALETMRSDIQAGYRPLISLKRNKWKNPDYIDRPVVILVPIPAPKRRSKR